MTDIDQKTKDYSRIRDNQMSILKLCPEKRASEQIHAHLDVDLDNPEGIPQHAIAQKTYSTKQVVNATIKSFKEKGYLLFEENPQDKRMKLIKMSEKGRAYAASVLDLLEKAETLAMSELTPTEQDLLLRISRKFTDALARTIGDYHD